MKKSSTHSFTQKHLHRPFFIYNFYFFLFFRLVLPAATAAAGWDVPAAVATEPAADHSHALPAKDDTFTAGRQTDAATATADNDPKQLRHSAADAANDLDAEPAAGLPAPGSCASGPGSAASACSSPICPPDEKGGALC